MGVDWIHLAEYRDCWQVAANMMNPWLLCSAANLLIIWTSISFSRDILLHVVRIPTDTVTIFLLLRFETEMC